MWHRAGLASTGARTWWQEPALAALLPLQILLSWKKFGIHSKIITETENMVKTCLKEAADIVFDEFFLKRNSECAACALSRGEGACTCVACEEV